MQFFGGIATENEWASFYKTKTMELSRVAISTVALPPSLGFEAADIKEILLEIMGFEGTRAEAEAGL